jgi:hypothetical protein
MKVMKVTLEIPQPNVMIDEDTTEDNILQTGVLFGLQSDDVIPVSRTIERIVSERIGELKVTKEDYNVISDNNEQISQEDRTKFTVPLKSCFDHLEGSVALGYGLMNEHSRVLGLHCLFDSNSLKDDDTINEWRDIRECLKDPNKYFDRWENENTWKLDRERTLTEMIKRQQELDALMADHTAAFSMIDAGEHYRKDCYIGKILLRSLKSEQSSVIDDTKLALVEALKPVKGPCLSKDALDLYDQFWRT